MPRAAVSAAPPLLRRAPNGLQACSSAVHVCPATADASADSLNVLAPRQGMPGTISSDRGLPPISSLSNVALSLCVPT